MMTKSYWYFFVCVSDTTVDKSSTSSKLFVGHLPHNISVSELQSLFPGCVSAKIVTDKLTGSPKGYAQLMFITHNFYNYYIVCLGHTKLICF